MALTVADIDSKLARMGPVATNPGITPELRKDAWPAVDAYLDQRLRLTGR